MRRTAKAFGSFLAIFVYATWGCASRLVQEPGDGSVTAGKYTNRTYGVTLSFPDTAGWSYLTTKDALDEFGNPHVIFAARNSSRFLTVAILLNDGGLEISNEDYQMALKLNLLRAGEEDYEEISLATETTNDEEWVKWTYRRGGQTNTQAFFKRGTQNFVVWAGTLDAAYIRRKSEIESIVSSFRFLP